MTTARLVQYLIPDRRVAGIKATSLTKYFVIADIVSFIVQATGGTMLSGNPSVNTMKIGMDIYRAGIGLQEYVRRGSEVDSYSSCLQTSKSISRRGITQLVFRHGTLRGLGLKLGSRSSGHHLDSCSYCCH